MKSNAVCLTALLLANAAASLAQTDPRFSTKPAGVIVDGERLAPEKAPVDLSRGDPQSDFNRLTGEEQQYLLEASQGKTWAQTRLGVLYARTENDLSRWEQAMKFLQAASEAGDPEAQYQLAIMHASGKGTAKSFIDALRYCRMAAEQGYLPAVYSLGSLLATGDAGFADDAEAANWFQRGAAEDDNNSIFALANLKIIPNPKRF